jgi:hypothetical protein
MIQRLLILSIVPFLYSKTTAVGIRGNHIVTTESGCERLFGNPCGALRICIADSLSSNGFRCEANTAVEPCNVICGEGSTCVRDVKSRKFECRCEYGFYKPDPYFDCSMIDGFQYKM